MSEFKVGDILQLKSAPKETTIRITKVYGQHWYNCEAVKGYGDGVYKWTNQQLPPTHWRLVKRAKQRKFI